MYSYVWVHAHVKHIVGASSTIYIFWYTQRSCEGKVTEPLGDIRASSSYEPPASAEWCLLFGVAFHSAYLWIVLGTSCSYLFTAWKHLKPGSLTFWNSCIALNTQPLCTMALITVNQWQADSSIIAARLWILWCNYFVCFRLPTNSPGRKWVTKMYLAPNLCPQ